MARININEEQIRQIIAETAKKILKEGYPYGDPYTDKWYYLTEHIEPETLYYCIYTFFSADQLTALIDQLDKDGYLDGYYEEKGEFLDNGDDE